VLLEREHVLARLTSLLEESSTGDGRLVFLAGEAGVGKTSVVAALAAGVRADVRVRSGSSDSITTAAALGPFLEAVPELGGALEGVGGVDRLLLFRRLRAALATGPTLLVLEDVHWADEATLDMLRFLGRRLVGLPLLVVATYRDDETGASSRLTGVLGDLATAPHVIRETLAPLSVAAVGELTRAAGTGVSAEELHATTGGNPFYATEILAAPGSSMPVTIRDAVLSRVAMLTDDGRQVLAAASVLARPTGLDLLAAVAEVPPAAVDECVRWGVLVADDRGLRFRHELARRAVEESLFPGVRAHLHGRALQTLRTSGAPDEGRLATHAAAAGMAAAVLEFAPRAAARASRLGAHREAAEGYRLALRWAGGVLGETDPRRAELLESLAYECYLTDELDEALDARRRALGLAERIGDAVASGRNQCWISRLCWPLGRHRDSEAFAARAVATLEEAAEDGPELAMAYSNLAQRRLLAGDTSAAVAAGNRAIELARRIGDRNVEIDALNNVGTALSAVDDDPGGTRLLHRSLDLALLDDVHALAARAWTNLGSIAVRNRRLADADRLLRAGIDWCAERDLDFWTLHMQAWLARSLAEQGRLADAEELAEQVLHRPHLSAITRMMAASVAGIAARRQGRPGDDRLAEALELATGGETADRRPPVSAARVEVAWLAARAEAAWLAGRVPDIVDEVDRAWPAALALRNPWTLGELSWWLAVTGLRRNTPAPVAAPFALMLDKSWRAAAQAWRELGCPLWEAIALGASADLADGRRAAEIADRLGASAVRDALLRSRQAQGIPVPRGPRGPAADHPARLTARELEVLEQLARGMTNAAIGQQLFLSEKTVGHHVSAILRKLDEPTRAGAVAAALRREIIAPT
jgi:DNA-binding CsgD family transcriptional regulator/tetratricopeptide (TPR) repeat protein